MLAPLENPQLPEAGAKAEASVRKFVKRLDAHLGEQEWMAAGRFSIADITTYLTCGFCNVMQWQPYKEFENLSRHYGAVKAKLG